MMTTDQLVHKDTKCDVTFRLSMQELNDVLEAAAERGATLQDLIKDAVMEDINR